MIRILLIYFAAFTLLSLKSFASAPMCASLFSAAPSQVREPHFPGSVYAKFPENVMPKLLDMMSMEALERTLNQMTIEVSADIPLPESIGATSKKIELDIDVEQFAIQNGSLISRLSSTFKTPKNDAAVTHEAPKDFHTSIAEPNSEANSQIALHLDMINAALKSSLADLATAPLKFSTDNILIELRTAPVLMAMPNAGKNQTHILARAEVVIPRSSIPLSGVAFKQDIRAQATLEAEFIVTNDNSVSLKVIGVHKEGFSLDPETMRVANSGLVGKSIEWALQKSALTVIDFFNRTSRKKPILIENLFRIPSTFVGLNLQILKMYIDNDGYLKVQLNISPKASQDSSLKLRLKNKE